MTEEQQAKLQFLGRRLKRLIQEQNKESEKLDPTKDNPELEN